MYLALGDRCHRLYYTLFACENLWIQRIIGFKVSPPLDQKEREVKTADLDSLALPGVEVPMWLGNF